MGSRVEKKSSSFPLGESQLNSEQEEIDKSLFFFFKKFLLLFFFFFWLCSGACGILVP